MIERLFIPLLTALTFFIFGSCLTSTTVEKDSVLLTSLKRDTIYRIDTFYDTLMVHEKNRYFHSFDDVILFTMYLKTQSNQLDEDNWSCIHTLFNRLDNHNVGWREYFNTPSINNSQTIKKIMRGEYEVDFTLERRTDRLLLGRVLDAYWGYNPTNCPRNILYFESHRKSPNKGIFLRSQIWKQYRHKFYYGDLKYELDTTLNDNLNDKLD